MISNSRIKKLRNGLSRLNLLVRIIPEDNSYLPHALALLSSIRFQVRDMYLLNNGLPAEKKPRRSKPVSEDQPQAEADD